MQGSLAEFHTRFVCLTASCLPAAKIIAHDQTEDIPGRSDRAPQRATDLRFPNARIVADRHFDNPESAERALQDHLNGPAVRGLLKRELSQDIRTPSAKRTQIADSQTIQYPDHGGRQPITKERVPRQRTCNVPFRKPRAQCNIRSAFSDGRQEKRQLSGSIAVVSVEKYNHVGDTGRGEPGQTGAPISAAWFAQNAGSHPFSNLSSSVCGVAVDHQDFGNKLGGKIGENAPDGLRFIMRGNDDGYAHWSWPGSPPRGIRPALCQSRRCPRPGPRALSRAPTMRGQEPAVPRSMPCPTPTSKGCRGTGTLQKPQGG